MEKVNLVSACLSVERGEGKGRLKGERRTVLDSELKVGKGAHLKEGGPA